MVFLRRHRVKRDGGNRTRRRSSGGLTDGDAKWETVSAIPGVFAANHAARRAARLPVVRFAP